MTDVLPRGPALIMPRLLAGIGRLSRARASFTLLLAAMSWGVFIDGLRPSSWRRTVSAELRRALRQAALGGLAMTLVTASLVGLALVTQAIYWLGLAGQQELAGSILVTVLVRELTPLFVGMVILGRCGTVTTVELWSLQTTGQVRVISAQGIDPALFLILPRAVAYALAGFTLGTLFVLTSLLVGFIAGSLLGATSGSFWTFLDNVLSAMQATDFAIFPAKMTIIGALVAMTACLTGLTARTGESADRLLPRAFVRGVLAIMLTSLLFSLAA
jgi:phospholipid/cholesterol/gamma-HCH transport system permease protein